MVLSPARKALQPHGDTGVKRGVKRVRQEYVEVLEGDQRVAHRGWERKG